MGTISILAVVAAAVMGGSEDVPGLAHDFLHGGNATAVDIQRTLAEARGWAAFADNGLILSGRSVTLQTHDPERVTKEVGTGAPVEYFFKVDGRGPKFLRIYIPTDPSLAGEYEIYRRLANGVYARLETSARQRYGYLSYELEGPGWLAVRKTDEFSYPPLDKAIFDFAPAVDTPEAKVNWRLQRELPDTVAGPMPLILIHGLATDRWGHFLRWAENSPEAELLRQNFQIWNFVHPTQGVNAATGFSDEYPGFDESIVAYLHRFICEAREEGVDQDGAHYVLPNLPLCFLTHSAGGVKARALLKNFPDIGEETLAVVSLNAPHTGLPFATPEWLRHTMTRLGISLPRNRKAVVTGFLSDLFLNGYMHIDRQCDMDNGWANFDAAGGFGMPTLQFQAWTGTTGLTTLTLSPRDANLTDARLQEGVFDETFEPAQLLSTYCGGLDEIMPLQRGDLYLDKFYTYGSFFVQPFNWSSIQPETPEEQAATEGGPKATTPADLIAQLMNQLLESLGVWYTHGFMGLVASEGAEYPAGAYAVGDGIAPIQSQLLLDGKETELVYRVATVNGWPQPVLPYELRMDIINEHTLFDPDRLRILPGWSHLDTITGRYNPFSGKSELFSMVLNDLMNAVEEAE